ncbi:MAG: sensor histidine kinase [Syntrophaceae bacterium]|nr:sensor histidine kinase [Syntrophaceae bacterium]
MNGSSFKKVVEDALIENTAQGIFNYLDKIEHERENYEKRWIWELLQNALDAAPPDRKIEIEIIENSDLLIFRHNGRPFESKEIAHLICHGSTKKETDIGKFGTGFLTTHLLSRKIKIKGVNAENKKFIFLLDRNGTSPDEIKEHMNKTLEDYEKSITSNDGLGDYTAEYEYPLTVSSLPTVKSGIRELTRICPFLLAFSDKFDAIKIMSTESNVTFKLTNENPNAVYIHKTIEEKNETTRILHELWIVKDNDIEVAIKGKKQDDRVYQIESLQGIPKIFLVFPLFGTQDLPFPTVVNSRKFEPTPERDGIYLGTGDANKIQQNKELLEKAIEMAIKLFSNINSNRWENIHTLLYLEYPPKKDWLDVDWYAILLKKCIDEIFKLRGLKTQSGDFITLAEGFIPIVDFAANQD